MGAPGLTAAMRVGVGSRNPVKLSAVERAFETIGVPATVAAVRVVSGVGEQPIGDDETLEGARNRARNALDGHDIGVGIEGGVAEGPDGWYLIMWAAATDGDQLSLGGGPRIPLPDRMAARVRGGEALGPVIDEVVGGTNVARGRGAAGVLTGGIIDRESALLHATAGALGPLVVDEAGAATDGTD